MDEFKLLKLPLTESYIENRLIRMQKEIQNMELDLNGILVILDTVHECCLDTETYDESHEFKSYVDRLRESINWLAIYTQS